jgi:hypothetical protein
VSKAKKAKKTMRGASEAPKRSAVEERLARLLEEDEEGAKGTSLPVTVQIELLRQDLKMWKNTLAHTRKLYGLASSLKDEERKRELWGQALRALKWKERLEREIASLEKKAKKVVEVTAGQPVIEEELEEEVNTEDAGV